MNDTEASCSMTHCSTGLVQYSGDASEDSAHPGGVFKSDSFQCKSHDVAWADLGSEVNSTHNQQKTDAPVAEFSDSSEQAAASATALPSARVGTKGTSNGAGLSEYFPGKA